MSENDHSERQWAGKRPEPKLWKKLKPLARQMRRQQTKAEELLWGMLRKRRRLGYKFRRQYSIERFIVDFYCADARLVVEVDGEVHKYTEEHDAVRQEYLESLGLQVLRFTNDQVFDNLRGVVVMVEETLKETPSA